MNNTQNEQYINLLATWLKGRKDIDLKRMIDFLNINIELQTFYIEEIELIEFYKTLDLFLSKVTFDLFFSYYIDSSFHLYPSSFLAPYANYERQNRNGVSYFLKSQTLIPEYLKSSISWENHNALPSKDKKFYERYNYPDIIYASYYYFEQHILPQIVRSMPSSGFATIAQTETSFSAEKGFYIGGGKHFAGDGHMLTVGGSGAGKGVNFIIPALLSPALVASGSSVVVLDPKGENLAICGEHLKRAGYKVLAINPFSIPEIMGFGKAGFNPFSLTSKNDIKAPLFCDLIAECLIPNDGKNDHWNESARQYISLYLLYMVATEQANFKNLFEAVRLGGGDRLDYLTKMENCQAFDRIISATAGGIAQQIEASKEGNNTEIESIFSTVKRGTDIFKNLELREHLKKSDFDLTKIAHEKTALFVCVNPAELQIFSGWLRVFFGCVFRTLQKYYNLDRRVLMVLDEFPQIGRLKEFEMGIAYMRGYNVTLWAIVQDLSQLKKLYWDSWETFIGSAAVKMWLPLGADNFTIDYLENRLPISNDKIIKESKITIEKNKIMSRFDLITCNDAIIEARGLSNFARFEKMPYWLLAWAKNASPNPFRK